ncbi:ABC transporter substrate-binding protein [Terrabacter carboxydivorans]|uniref:Solute-binding protein family 5 domain-containing protein n=1 Tax=Terrabacter carboxydivorans TaxID=619730 RepID=A0ABN3M4L5_9MICO
MRRRLVRTTMVATAGVLALATAACTSAATDVSTPVATDGTTAGAATPTPTSTTAKAPLVVGAVFDHSTLDPTRQFDRSGALLTHSLYETLTTLDPDDPTKVVPGMAEYTLSPEGRWLTLRLRKGLVFSDGTPVTTDDVIFTLERAKGLSGPAASIIGTVSTTKVDDRTFTLSSTGSNFALPAILANPAFGILNSTAVKANGGTIGPGDTAGGYLSQHSAGSGPYVIESVRGSSEVRLKANPLWTGPKPAFPEVIVRNLDAKRQLTALRTGALDVALDLSPNQAEGVDAGPQTSSVTITTMRSSSLVYLALARDKALNAWTANADFDEAVRRGLDREALARTAEGSMPAAGLIPAGIVGALEDLAPAPTPPATDGTGGTGTPNPTTSPPAPSSTAPSSTGTPATPSAAMTTGANGIPTPVVTLPIVPARDLTAAKAALRRSGYRGQPIPLSYAADLPIQGIPTTALASAVRSQLAEVGIKVQLNPAPAAEALAAYRSGRSAFSLWSWSPDYPDPENYLAFAPGELVGSRAGWARGTDQVMDDLTDAARSSVGDNRAGAYAAWQLAMNERSPFVPLLQPATRFASGDRVTAVPGNPVWTLDLARIR